MFMEEDMRISAKSKYAIKMLVDIAQYSNGEYISLSGVSERQNISKKFLEQIVPMLTRTGLVKANRGNKGGYKLSKPACKCTIGEILRATEGEILPVEETEYKSDETIQFLWEGMHDTLNGYIDRISVQDILEHENESFVYTI